MKNIRNINIQEATEKLREVKKAGAMRVVKISNMTEIIKILLLGAPLFLSGCMGMNSKFDCNIRPDGKCAPMGTIHKMADWGEFNENSNRKIGGYSNIVKAGRGGGNNKSNIWIGSNTNINNKYPKQRYFSEASFADHPLRSNETIQKIWIGPYEDENGNYHEASNVYAVIKKARWLAETEQTAKE